MTRYRLEMVENETVTVIKSRILRTLPFRPLEDQHSTGKVWEDWKEGIESEFHYFKIVNLQDNKDVINYWKYPEWRKVYQIRQVEFSMCTKS